MTKLRTSTSRRGLDLSARLRNLSREAGLGVVDALQQRPADQAPGWRAQQLARGAMRGIDEGLEDEHLQGNLSGLVDGVVDSALSAAMARGPEVRQLSEDTARAFARGALDEARAQLKTPLLVLAIAAGVGLVGALLLRRA